MIEIPKLTPHPIKGQLKKFNLRLWQVRRLLGNTISEGQLARILNGQVPMPRRIEIRLRRLLQKLEEQQVTTESREQDHE